MRVEDMQAAWSALAAKQPAISDEIAQISLFSAQIFSQVEASLSTGLEINKIPAATDLLAGTAEFATQALTEESASKEHSLSHKLNVVHKLRETFLKPEKPKN